MAEETPRDLKETEKAVEDAFEFNDDESFEDVVESLDIAPAEPVSAIPEEKFLDSEETSQEPEPISEENDEKVEESVQPESLQPEEEVVEEVEEEEERHEELQNVVNALQDSFQQLSATATKEKEETELVGLGLVMAEGEAKVEEQVTDGPPKIRTDALTGDNDFVPPTPGTPPSRSPFDPNSPPVEDSDDIETYSANLLALNKVDIKNIGPNTLDAREQEKADEPVLLGMAHLFNNRFMKAKKVFESEAETNPLFGFGMGYMAFLKAVMTFEEKEIKIAIDILTQTYLIAGAQIDAASKKGFGGSVAHYVSSYYSYIKHTRSKSLPHATPATSEEILKQEVKFLPNGVLRAHVIKAECCLQIAILQLAQETVVGYIKCGVNLRRAYTSYSLVWQEYKRMGQAYNDYMDRDTISGIQFGIGAVHLVLSTLPAKILTLVSAFGWKADKHLGFALIKLCLDNQRIRSPTASMLLLGYYTVLTTFAPQILSPIYTQPAIETLLDAQKKYPNSAFFLYFAGRTSRLARNLPLSTQSFKYASEISNAEWVEVDIRQVCDYEIATNNMMQLNWKDAAQLFEKLCSESYWSPILFKYLNGVCLEQMGMRTEAILAFAEVTQIASRKTGSKSNIEQYVLRKVESFQAAGYQDLPITCPALEYLYINNAFEFMDHPLLEEAMEAVDIALDEIQEREKAEYMLRANEIMPTLDPPDYYAQRGSLLLIKSAILNSMGRHQQSIIHLNWIVDHKDRMTEEKWVVPYAFWEAGLVTWAAGDKLKSRSLWETALNQSKFDFEYRLAIVSVI
ncbi:hypothetical protein K450DRAFT_218666 [Umbelopsis ramanniana AG]|uniref:Uncharacterized protein n=1 Tax=Umbelopsis ramanniana AG TaxID=1314678 RepID=A0AAD5EJ45_UMBRA|nr:uncharacterized protein K450DRAFT_218666 [Umbelopsis ramanniana AG]KAI8584209.1 hypothetical protein K450DRAFT_218666 [Umbelopsis ramanniana AG]